MAARGLVKKLKNYEQSSWLFAGTCDERGEDETRDGHGIPKCSPCPSVFFFIPLGPSVRFRVFWRGWRVRMSVIRTAEIPKIGKIKAKIRASVD